MEREKNFEPEVDTDQEYKIISDKKITRQKNNLGMMVGLVILVLLLLGGGAYFFIQQKGSAPMINNLEKDEQKLAEEEIKWLSYISDDEHFKIYYPSNWQILDDENFYFSAALYNKDSEQEALIKVRKIEATNKTELQEALDAEYQTCLETQQDCPPAVDIEELTKIKISGETSRIDTENQYLSGTTNYIYAKDYYLVLYHEYNNHDLLPTFEKIIDNIHINIEQRYKHFYCNKETGQVSSMWGYNAYCHVVEPGETLWSIAERYYGDPYLWEQLKLYDEGKEFDITRLSPDDPKALMPGTTLVLWQALQFSSSYNDKTAGGISDGWGLDTDTGDLFTATDQKIYINKDIYDGPFGWTRRFFIDERTNNKVYLISPPSSPGGVHQLVVNKERNPYLGEGYNFDLLTFNHNEDLYAVRTNVRQDVPDPGFIVLSNIGNGPEYNYSDSIIWYDSDTLLYRAQKDNKWRLVINHEDYVVYDYLENLRVEDDIIKFDARHDDGSWTKEEIYIGRDDYNPPQEEFSGGNNSKAEQEAYLESLRQLHPDFSEEEIWKLEQKRHYKEGILVDEFKNPVKEVIEIYLDPVEGTGISEDVGRLSFKTKDGKFQFLDGKFELYVEELGAYNLSLQEGWSSESLESINPIDFRYKENNFEIIASNEKYDKQVRDGYIELAEEGDALWTMAEEYYSSGCYWPLLADNSGLNTLNGMPEISTGDAIYVFPFSFFHQDQINEFRKIYQVENTEEKFTIINEEYGYEINYTVCWEPSETNIKEGIEYYNGDRLKILAPIPAKEPRGIRSAYVYVNIYNNDSYDSIEEFVVGAGIRSQDDVDKGYIHYEEKDDGSFLLTPTTESKHLIFFKDDFVYDIVYQTHHSVDDITEQEMLDIVNSFKFIN
ncbi:LysM domain-containing protein [Candidatus Parcubacteria bacterium]|nr:MAG: LysM domain-containing protein [Candidatus Parcubacteria bacterium]